MTITLSAGTYIVVLQTGKSLHLCPVNTLNQIQAMVTETIIFDLYEQALFLVPGRAERSE